MVATVTLQLVGQSQETACPSMKGSALLEADMCRYINLLENMPASTTAQPKKQHQSGPMGLAVEKRSVCKVRKRVQNTDPLGNFTTNCNLGSLANQDPVIHCILLQPQHTNWNLKLDLQNRPFDHTQLHGNKEKSVCSILEDQTGGIRALFRLSVILHVCKGLGANCFDRRC